MTHAAYSLYFPEEKQEWWWLYIADRRDQTLVSMPYHVCTLKDTEEVRPSCLASVKNGRKIPRAGIAGGTAVARKLTSKRSNVQIQMREMLRKGLFELPPVHGTKKEISKNAASALTFLVSCC